MLKLLQPDGTVTMIRYVTPSPVEIAPEFNNATLAMDTSLVVGLSTLSSASFITNSWKPNHIFESPTYSEIAMSLLTSTKILFRFIAWTGILKIILLSREVVDRGPIKINEWLRKYVFEVFDLVLNFLFGIRYSTINFLPSPLSNHGWLMVYLVRLKPEGDVSEAYSNRSVLLQSNPAPNSVVICPT